MIKKPNNTSLLILQLIAVLIFGIVFYVTRPLDDSTNLGMHYFAFVAAVIAITGMTTAIMSSKNSNYATEKMQEKDLLIQKFKKNKEQLELIYNICDYFDGNIEFLNDAFKKRYLLDQDDRVLLEKINEIQMQKKTIKDDELKYYIMHFNNKKKKIQREYTKLSNSLEIISS